MKKALKYLLTLFVAVFSLTSCLESNLEDLETYNGAEILTFSFECRFIDPESNKLRVTKMNGDCSVDTDEATVTCDIVVPASNETSLSDEERAQVDLTALVGYCDISTAATLKPLDGAPVLGKIADWSDSEFKYQVTAADGTKKTWTVIINSFTK